MASVRKAKGSTAKKVLRPSRKNLKKKISGIRAEAKVSPRPNESANPSAGYFLFAGLFLTAAGLYSLPNFHLMFPKDGHLYSLLVHPSLLWVGFACLVYSFFQHSEEARENPMPRRLAYPLFAFFFGLCFFWRFYNPLEPSAPFWFDNLVVTGDIVNIIDVHQHHLLFPWGQREPFFPYLTAALWELIPKAGGVWIVRFSCTVIDLIAIWCLYLLGSTLGGRRLGLLLMAFWSVSLPMTIWNYFGMGQNTAALGAIVSLLFFYRLIQKPTLARFIYWGAALGFGGYCYVPYRPWPPAMITLVLLWILFASREKIKGTWPLLLAGGLWVSWAFLFFHKNNYLPEKNPLVVILLQPWFLTLWAALLVGAYVKTYLEKPGKEINQRLFGWASGVFVTGLFMAPLYLHPDYSQHTTASSVFMNDNGPLPLPEALKAIWHNVQFFFSAMFGQPTEDVSRYPLPGQSYFESFPELCMVIGLAYFAARPTWLKGTVLLMAFVGMTSWVFSNHPHTGRVESAVPPLLLLGAMGLDAFTRLMSRLLNNKMAFGLVFVLLAGLWAWDANFTFQGIRTWMADKSNDARISAQLDKDWRQYRVIMSRHYPEFIQDDMTVLCDQKEAYLLNDPNPIFLEPGQTEKDIVFLMYGSTRFDKPLEDRVRSEFPQAQWSVIECSNKDIPRFMLRAVIPFSALSETPGKIFYIQRVPHEYWRRRFYWKDYGVGRGMVWWDDRVASWTANFPPGANEFMSVRLDGEIKVAAAGDYLFKVPPTLDVNILSIDGKTIVSLKPQGTAPDAQKKVYLEAGIHQVSFVTTFRRAYKLAEIRVVPPNGGAEWVLGQTSSPNQP